MIQTGLFDQGGHPLDFPVQARMPVLGLPAPSKGGKEMLAIRCVLEQAVKVYAADAALLPAQSVLEVGARSRPGVGPAVVDFVASHHAATGPRAPPSGGSSCPGRGSW